MKVPCDMGYNRISTGMPRRDIKKQPYVVKNFLKFLKKPKLKLEQ